MPSPPPPLLAPHRGQDLALREGPGQDGGGAEGPGQDGGGGGGNRGRGVRGVCVCVGGCLSPVSPPPAGSLQRGHTVGRGGGGFGVPPVLGPSSFRLPPVLGSRSFGVLWFFECVPPPRGFGVPSAEVSPWFWGVPPLPVLGSPSLGVAQFWGPTPVLGSPSPLGSPVFGFPPCFRGPLALVSPTLGVLTFGVSSPLSPPVSRSPLLPPRSRGVPLSLAPLPPVLGSPPQFQGPPQFWSPLPFSVPPALGSPPLGSPHLCPSCFQVSPFASSLGVSPLF